MTQHGERMISARGIVEFRVNFEMLYTFRVDRFLLRAARRVLRRHLQR
jgi:hypothetical protein